MQIMKEESGREEGLQVPACGRTSLSIPDTCRDNAELHDRHQFH